MSCPVTVLMAVHNGGEYLKVAMDSILQQTFSNFRFLIVDDASNDGTVEVVKSYNDARIQLVRLENNVGQTAALNVGLRQATTPWIARMDADDYSDITRLEEQMRAVEESPGVDCFGTYAWIFRDDPHAVESEITTHLEHSAIKQALLSGSPLIHGTIMVKREALLDVGGYDGRFRYSADLEMYDRLLAKYNAATVPRRLLGIRRHQGQGSRTDVAFNENIEIFTDRLRKNRYSTGEAAVVRSSLGRFYLFRAKRRGGRGDLIGLLFDVLLALKTSPRSFPMDFTKVSLVDLVPEKSRARAKKVLTRFGG